MAYTDQQVLQWFKDNPNATDAQIAQTASQAGVSAEQLARVTGKPLQEITQRASTASPNTVLPAPQISQRQQEINDWVYKSEPKEYQDLYTALQSGKAKVIGDPDNGFAVVDANGKQLEGVYVNPDNGQITVPTSNGRLYVNAQIGQGGTLAPIAPENYNKQVSYQSNGNDWDQYGGLVLTAAGMLGAPYLSGLIGGATGLTGASLAAATGATIGGVGAGLTGGDVLKGALLGGAGGYLTGSLSGSGPSTDLGMNSQLTPAAIESGLGTPGYGFNASASSSGLFNPALIGAGAYTQTSYPYDMADFLAADTLQLQGQVGNNLPAIEQNLVASGVDPLVAADVANQVALNPGISQYDLTNYINTNFGGGNIYDVGTSVGNTTATQSDYSNEGRNYPTTVSTQGTGGSPVNASTAAAAGAGLTASQISNLVKAGLSLGGIAGASGMLGGGSGMGIGALPAQNVPTNTPEYYQAIQQYYNTYMPEVPRDVATPLQQWYDSKYGA